jgi:hypothetical protein
MLRIFEFFNLEKDLHMMNIKCNKCVLYFPSAIKRKDLTVTISIDSANTGDTKHQIKQTWIYTL